MWGFYIYFMLEIKNLQIKEFYHSVKSILNLHFYFKALMLKFK